MMSCCCDVYAQIKKDADSSGPRSITVILPGIDDNDEPFPYRPLNVIATPAVLTLNRTRTITIRTRPGLVSLLVLLCSLFTVFIRLIVSLVSVVFHFFFLLFYFIPLSLP